jgi:uncharacterized protein (DUF2147 family)
MKKLAILAAALLAAAPAQAAVSSPLVGVWTNPKRSVTVRIAPCGQQLCGRVVAASPKAKKDAAESGTRNLVGTTILSGLAPAGANRWRGRVFMPKANRRATAKLSLTARNRLNVEGCVLSVLCKSQTWSRVS